MKYKIWWDDENSDIEKTEETNGDYVFDTEEKARRELIKYFRRRVKTYRDTIKRIKPLKTA